MSWPDGWKEIEERHPDHGVVAYSNSWFQHTNGSEIVIWSGVEEDARDYTVNGNDEYAVEIYNGKREYIKGEVFETEEEATQAAHEAMEAFPLESQEGENVEM